VLNTDGRILAGATGGLSGKVHTVSREELFATVHFLEHVAGHATLYIDNRYVVDGIAKIRGEWRAVPTTEHGDLWGRIAEHVDIRLRMIDTRKIKSSLGRLTVSPTSSRTRLPNGTSSLRLMSRS
jgi:hypothetical protein